MQIVYQGIFLKEYILIESYFMKGGIYIILDKMMIPE